MLLSFMDQKKSRLHLVFLPHQHAVEAATHSNFVLRMLMSFALLFLCMTDSALWVLRVAAAWPIWQEVHAVVVGCLVWPICFCNPSCCYKNMYTKTRK